MNLKLLKKAKIPKKGSMANHNNENEHCHEKVPIDTGHLSGQKRAKHNKTTAPHLTFTFQNAIKYDNFNF